MGGECLLFGGSTRPLQARGRLGLAVGVPCLTEPRLDMPAEVADDVPVPGWRQQRAIVRHKGRLQFVMGCTNKAVMTCSVIDIAQRARALPAIAEATGLRKLSGSNSRRSKVT